MQLQELNVCVRRKKHNQPLVKLLDSGGNFCLSSIAYKLNLNTEIYGALFWKKRKSFQTKEFDPKRETPSSSTVAPPPKPQDQWCGWSAALPHLISCRDHLGSSHIAQSHLRLFCRQFTIVWHISSSASLLPPAIPSSCLATVIFTLGTRVSYTNQSK